jgi:hypothetical protein
MLKHLTMISMPRARPRALAALLAAAATAAAADEHALDAVRADYDNGHYPRAFERAARLADGGHCEAARLAREMVRHGPRLYAARFNVAPERLARWRAVPRCEAGSALAAASSP